MSEKDHIITNPSDVQAGGLGKRFPRNLVSKNIRSAEN